MEDREQGLLLASNEVASLDREPMPCAAVFSAIGDNARVTHGEPEDLHDRERIFVARTLRQAKKVEALLTQAGVDYDVQVEPFGRSFLFRTIRHGAVFYVSAAQAAHCRERLAEAGFGKGVVESDPTDRD
jgi:hypothetical protein